MPSILHLIASPKGDASTSGRLARIFLDELRQAEPEARIDALPLFETDLPEFGRLAAEAKFAPIFGDPVTPEHEAAWRPILDHIARFDAADRILVSAPMWNGSIPYRLKHYLDLIMQPQVTFGYDRESMRHVGLLRNRPVQLILTRSSIMPGDWMDFQLPYLRFAFDFIGLRDLRVITAWRTTQPTRERRESYLAAFEGEARRAAREFIGQ